MRSAVSSTPTPRTEGQAPSQRVDQQAEIARVADDTVKPGGDQGVTGLDCDQPAEPISEDKDWPEPQGTSEGERTTPNQRSVSPVEVQNALRSCRPADRRSASRAA